MMDTENKLLLYKDENGKVSVNVRFADEDVWLTQVQLVEVYQSSKSNISEHIKHIFDDGELEKNSVVRDFRTTAADEKKYTTHYYNLDMIITLGYRVQSEVAVRFRRWATQRLYEYIQKGFTMDDERPKQGGNCYFRELLQRIRDIRVSEKMFYQKWRNLFKLSSDYEAKAIQMFFAETQNMLSFQCHTTQQQRFLYYIQTFILNPSNST